MNSKDKKPNKDAIIFPGGCAYFPLALLITEAKPRFDAQDTADQDDLPDVDGRLVGHVDVVGGVHLVVDGRTFDRATLFHLNQLGFQTARSSRVQRLILKFENKYYFQNSNGVKCYDSWRK